MCSFDKPVYERRERGCQLPFSAARLRIVGTLFERDRGRLYLPCGQRPSAGAEVSALGGAAGAAGVTAGRRALPRQERRDFSRDLALRGDWCRAGGQRKVENKTEGKAVPWKTGVHRGRGIFSLLQFFTSPFCLCCLM